MRQLARHGFCAILLHLCVAAAGPAPAFAADAGADDRWFLDHAGVRRPFVSSYEGWFARHSREPDYLRAAAESVALVTLGTAYYWVDPLANSADWDYPSLGSKLRFESVRFDNNLFATNHLLHPLAGTAVYGFSRVNGLHVGMAFVNALVASVGWEYLLEYREQASINDMVFTPLGGLAIGEFLFQLGDYLNSAPDGGGPAQRAAAFSFGLPQRAHDALDGVRAPSTPPRDQLGFSSAFTHRFVVGYEAGIVARDRHADSSIHGFSVEADLAAMPGFLRPGRFSRSFADGNFVAWRSRVAWSRNGSSSVDLSALADLVGHYEQDIASSQTGRDGRAALVALSTRFRFNQRNLLGYRDRFASVQLPGPHAVVWFLRHGWVANLDVAMHGEFAGIHPLAYADFQRQNGPGLVRSILERERYVYALGFSTLASAEVGVRDAGIGLAAGYAAYDSIQGVDRLQERVVNDVASHDTIRELGAYVVVRPRAGPLLLRLAIDDLRRTGRIANARALHSERRLSLLSGVVF